MFAGSAALATFRYIHSSLPFVATDPKDKDGLQRLSRQVHDATRMIRFFLTIITMHYEKRQCGANNLLLIQWEKARSQARLGTGGDEKHRPDDAYEASIDIENSEPHDLKLFQDVGERFGHHSFMYGWANPI